MFPWRKRRESAASATNEKAQDKNTFASQANTSANPEPRNDGPSPDPVHQALKPLAEVLRVDPDATASDEDLIRRSVVKHFPPLPPGGDCFSTPERLEEHLRVVRRSVHDELQRLGPMRERCSNLAALVPTYHRHSTEHVLALLESISTSQLAFVLLEWLCNAFFSREFFGDPDFSEDNQRSPVNMHLYCETVIRVHETLLTTLTTDIQSSLDGIFQRQQSESWTSVELHTDVIQCIDDPIVRAKAVSENLQQCAQRICFLHLQEFLQRFNTAKQQLLKRYKKLPKMAGETCLKTLNTCHGLTSYIQTSIGGETRDSTAVETLALLRTMEIAALKSVEEALIGITKDPLKKLFQTSEGEFQLMEVKEMMDAGGCHSDIQKRVLDLAYERVSALYLLTLVSSNRKDLEKRWGQGVGQRVSQDARQLHRTFSDLAPGVSQQNHVLLKVDELLSSQDVDSVKLTLSEMMQLCRSEKKLLPRLLKWKDLSRVQVREVLEAVEDPSSGETRPWWSHISCIPAQ